MFYKRLKNLCEHLVMFNDGYSLDFILKISVTETRRWVETIHFDPDENWETVFDMFDVDKYIREYENNWSLRIEGDILFKCEDISYEQFCKDMLMLINYVRRDFRIGNQFDFRIGMMDDEFSQNITFKGESRDDEFRRIYNKLFNQETSDDENEQFTVRANTIFNISGLKNAVDNYVKNAKHVVAYDKVTCRGISRYTWDYVTTSNTIPTKHNLAIIDIDYELNYDGVPASIIMEDLGKNFFRKLSPTTLLQLTTCVKVHYHGGKITMPEIKSIAPRVSCPNANYRAVGNMMDGATKFFKTFFHYYMPDQVNPTQGAITTAYLMFIVNEKKDDFTNAKVIYYSNEMWASMIHPVWKPKS